MQHEQNRQIIEKHNCEDGFLKLVSLGCVCFAPRALFPVFPRCMSQVSPLSVLPDVDVSVSRYADCVRRDALIWGICHVGSARHDWTDVRDGKCQWSRWLGQKGVRSNKASGSRIGMMGFRMRLYGCCNLVKCMGRHHAIGAMAIKLRSA